MDADRWRLVEDVYYRALDLSENERETFLVDACGDDGELYREVASLLQAGDRTGPARELVGSGLRQLRGEEPADGERPPERFGPYRVVREIGRGGLGTVYLAERDDEHFSKEVAVKWVRRGLDTDEILARLRRERQILARLEHPHITRLLDGGSTPDGRPYLVMEHVDGRSIDVYADDRRLSVRDRVRLILQVCSAVTWAHRNLVIHRDLKPANILVTDDGTVKLLDFGIAKLLDSNGEPSLTVPEQRWATPEYAGPEQLRGLPLSTATDVYALGATLYRLLVGLPPFDRRSRTAESLAPRAVERLDDHGRESLEESARRCGVTPARLRRQLRHDLDNILAKALAQEPEDRYGSVAELADDLHRYLEDRPVSARRPSFAVRVWKAVRRRRLASGAVALTFLSLVSGVSATAWQAQKARRAQVEAERVSDFLAELLEASKPEVARGEEVTVRSVLDRGAERIGAEPTDEPEVQTRLMNTMGRAFHSLGLYDRAEELHRRALSILQEAPGNPSAVAVSAHALAEALISAGRLEEAEGLLHRALTIRREQLGPDHPKTAETLDTLGILHRRLRRAKEAEAYLKEALGIYRRQAGTADADIARVLHNLGVLYTQEGRFREAEKHLRQAVLMRRGLLGDDHPDALSSRGSLAQVLRLRGRIEEAAGILEEVAASRLELLGPAHPDLAGTWNSLAKISEARGQSDRAAEFYGRAVDILTASLGPDSRTTAVARTNLALALRRAGRFEESESHLRRALAVQEGRPEDLETARTLGILGSLLCEAPRTADEGEALLIRAVDVHRGLHPQGSGERWRLAGAEADLGACLHSRGRSAEAADLYRSAHRELERRFGSDSPRAQQVQEALGSLSGF